MNQDQWNFIRFPLGEFKFSWSYELFQMNVVIVWSPVQGETMYKFSLILALLFTTLTLVSCSGDSGGGSSPAPQEEGSTGGTTGGTTNGSLTYDSELPAKERHALDTSTETMSALVIDGRQIRSFSQIFGGNKSSNVAQYFDTRVNYALSASTNIDDRFVVSVQPDNLVLALSEGVVMASNLSYYLWYESKAREPDLVQFEINGKTLKISSTRIGVMQIGDPYVGLTTIEQVTILVHEARHSDCTGGTLASDIERWRSGLIPLNHACAHLHALCPPGHPLAGEYACDEHPWGAYIIGAIYAAAISVTCSSCTETQKAIAEISSMESLTRLLYDLGDLLNGRFGPPNMSSSNQVR